MGHKEEYIIGFSNLKHGACHDNERLIDTNIESRIVTGKKFCVCEEIDFKPPPPKQELKKEIALLADAIKRSPSPQRKEEP